MEPPSPLPPFPDSAWRGLFASYLDLMTNVSVCPPALHFANLLAVIASEFGDRIQLDEGMATYTNFYIFCCAKTGAKKSTASWLVYNYIIENMAQRQHYLLTSVSSAEGLIRVLSKRPNTFLRYDEGADLFATANRTGQRIEPILNQAFDLSKLDSIVKRQRDSVWAHDYCLNALLNGTPDHVRLELSEALLSGGLLNRFCVFGAVPTGVYRARIGTPERGATLELAARLTSIVAGWRSEAPARNSVRVGFSPEAESIHQSWGEQNETAMNQLDDHESKPLTRLDMFVKKLAMIYCLLETAPTPHPCITAGQMLAAIDVMMYCKASMLWMLKAWTGPKTLQQKSETLTESRVEGYLKSNGCSPERDIYRLLNIGATECKKAMDALENMGVVTIINDRPRMVHIRARCRCFKVNLV